MTRRAAEMVEELKEAHKLSHLIPLSGLLILHAIQPGAAVPREKEIATVAVFQALEDKGTKKEGGEREDGRREKHLQSMNSILRIMLLCGMRLFDVFNHFWVTYVRACGNEAILRTQAALTLRPMCLHLCIRVRRSSGLFQPPTQLSPHSVCPLLHTHTEQGYATEIHTI